RTAPFEIKYGSVGSFETPLGVHVNLQPNGPLLDLYLEIKAALDALGLPTYTYDADSWRPHMTLSCGHWTADDVAFIRGMFTRLDASFRAETLEVNRLEVGTERWIKVRDVPLSGVVGDRD